GERFRKQCADPKNCVDFKNAFLGDESSLGPQTFHMDNIKADGGNVTVDFHYCALVSAWQKLGFDDETVALLCDMAMDGDRGIAQAMGLELSLDDTIAKGCASCKLHFHQ
ncbi:MAG: L-2-amino-thiazoline-4-carboxylic acid hydrolase, partial [Bacillota bacterium]